MFRLRPSLNAAHVINFFTPSFKLNRFSKLFVEDGNDKKFEIYGNAIKGSGLSLIVRKICLRGQTSCCWINWRFYHTI
jgi:hypothetical protein